VLVRTGQRLPELELLTASPSSELLKRAKKIPDLEEEINPVLGRIALLAQSGLTALMVLVNFL
jgi:hypothetical protein